MEERLRYPDMHEVKFLDEKIIEKENRSLGLLKKKESTPFLDNHEMDIKSTFSAPLPDIRDLPRQIYTNDVFPKLNYAYFGMYIYLYLHVYICL